MRLHLSLIHISVFFRPIASSYSGAPAPGAWSLYDRDAIARLVVDEQGGGHIEFNAADPAANPYLAFSLLLHAGLDGVEQGLSLSSSPDESCSASPATLKDAVIDAWNSEFVRRVVPGRLLENYLELKALEADQASRAADVTAYCIARHFQSV